MSYYTTLPDTLFTNGTDLQTLDGVVLENLDCLLAPGLRRGSNEPIPRRRGVLAVEKVLDAYSFTLHVTIHPVNSSGAEPGTLQAKRALSLTNYRVLRAAVVGTNGLVPLARRLSTTSSYTTDTAAGEFVSAANLHSDDDMVFSVDLEFLNLSGAWLDVDGVTWKDV